MQDGYKGVFEVFVAQFGADGRELEFATYLGGPGDDRATSIAIAKTGVVHIAGFTSSGSFPISQDAVQTRPPIGVGGFVVRLMEGVQLPPTRTLYWQHIDGTVLVWYMGGSDGSLLETQKILAGPSAVWRLAATADLDGDGNRDLVWQSTVGSVVVWYMGGADASVPQWSKAIAGPADVWRLAAMADLDGDSKPDLLWQRTDGVVVVWYMGGADGSSPRLYKQLAGPSQVWNLVAAADLDGNGNADLIWQSTNGTVAVWYMGGADGSVTQSTKTLAGPSSVWRVAASIDLNDNGKPDIIWQATTGSVAAWYMGGPDGSLCQATKALAGPSETWRVVGPR